MKFRTCLKFIAAIALACASLSVNADEETAAIIKQKINNGARIQGRSITARSEVKNFYNKRKFESLWLTDGKISSQAKELIEEINSCWEEGLQPKFYHKDALDKLLALERDKILNADLDLLLTDAFFVLASNYNYGVVSPYNFLAGWFKKNSKFDYTAFLNSSFESNNIKNSLELLLPNTNGYRQMKRELAHYRKIAAENIEWPKIAKGKKLKRDDIDPRVALTKKRLLITGELKSLGSDENSFDENLEAAIKDFQGKHGLLADGVLGDNTIYDLNKDARWWEAELLVNMDRVRALSKIIDAEKYILVNIPDFEVYVFENGSLVLNAKAIVGRKDRETPIMSDKVRYIVFSPKWRVPSTIAVEDKLPELQKDPHYLEKNDMSLFIQGETELEAVDPNEVDWTSINKDNFNYVIIQDSGNGNALGHIKFMFPNKYDVYMHDTPSRYLFERGTRNFSSGCVRMNKPVELAQYLLNDKPEWTMERITKAMNHPKESFVNLSKPVPIHIMYLTAWGDDNGSVFFRRDIYQYNQYAKAILMK